MTEKNKSAVHLGRLSANKRREKAGSEEAFSQSMKELRKKGLQKSEDSV